MFTADHASRLRRCALSFALSSWPGTVAAAELFVDGDLGGDCLGTYDAATRSCGGGDGDAYATLGTGIAAAGVGDRVRLRAGTYAEPLIPTTSGTASEPIVIEAYRGETVTIAGVNAPAVFLQGVSFIEIRGLTITNVLGFGRLEDASDIVIENNAFVTATAEGTTGGLKLVRASHCRVTDNRFEDGNDNVVVQESDFNVVADNTFFGGRHSLLSIRCSDYNVIRGNVFDNPDQKAAEIFDCEAVSDAPYELDATRHNLFEGNTFAHTLGSDQPHDYNAIQYAGQLGIVRRNTFYDNLGGGLAFQVYSDEALYNYGHRVFNNTFYANACFGLSASSVDSPDQYYGSLVVNNLFHANVSCSGEALQVSVGNESAVSLLNNAVETEAPGFVDPDAFDLRLAEDSRMVDAGVFVTHTVGEGEGTRLAVEDASWFFDGYGIAGEVGDAIQLEGQADVARIVEVDREGSSLILDTPLAWAGGEGVHLAYGGDAPDMGAHEVGVEDEPTPSDDSGGMDETTGGSSGAESGGGAGESGEGSGDDEGSSGSGGGTGNAESGPQADGCGCALAPANGAALRLAWILVLLASLRQRRQPAAYRARASTSSERLPLSMSSLAPSPQFPKNGSVAMAQPCSVRVGAIAGEYSVRARSLRASTCDTGEWACRGDAPLAEQACLLRETFWDPACRDGPEGSSRWDGGSEIVLAFDAR